MKESTSERIHKLGVVQAVTRKLFYEQGKC